MKLNELKDNQGASKDRMRVGRGVGSGKAKTSGRGQKGQKARTGVAIKGFEGGQMPLYRRLPKRGFNNINSKNMSTVNIGRVQAAFDAGKLDPKKPVDAAALISAGVVRRVKDGVRLLGKGELKAKADFVVAGASQSAIEAVEKAGGKVKIEEYKTPSSKPKAKAEKAEAKKAPAKKKTAKKAPAKKEK
jgi:large subunit ribosomal protein L15